MLHLLQKGTLSRVHREKGKFRSFLLASLQYFLADERDKMQAQKRGGGVKVVELDDQEVEKRYQQEWRISDWRIDFVRQHAKWDVVFCRQFGQWHGLPAQHQRRGLYDPA